MKATLVHESVRVAADTKPDSKGNTVSLRVDNGLIETTRTQAIVLRSLLSQALDLTSIRAEEGAR